MLMSAFLNTVTVYYLGCVSPLGMEDGRIKDSQITTSSVLGGTYGYQARLNQVIPRWGGWCPDVSEGKINERIYDQYTQIDLLNLTKITGIATQGGEYLGGREYVRDYKISYRRDGGVWNFYQEKDQTVKVNLIDFLNWYVRFVKTLLCIHSILNVQVGSGRHFILVTFVVLLQGNYALPTELRGQVGSIMRYFGTESSSISMYYYYYEIFTEDKTFKCSNDTAFKI